MSQATADVITPAFPKPKRKAPRTRINKVLDAVEPDPDLELEPDKEPDDHDEDGGDEEPIAWLVRPHDRSNQILASSGLEWQ